MTLPPLQRWLADKTAFDPALLDAPALRRLLERRMEHCATQDELAYLARLQFDDEELEHVIEAVAVPETALFRYPESYRELAQWLGHRRVNNRAEHLRMLSVPCSTGEEPCSMAVTAASAGWDLDKVHIDAVDRSGRAIERARRMRFSINGTGRGVPEWARSWFQVTDELAKAAPQVRTSVEFRHADVLKLPRPPVAYDVIFCRNLLIYLSAPARRWLLSWLENALASEGRLFVGHAEGANLGGAFVAVDAHEAFAYTHGPTPPAPDLPIHRDRPTPRSAPAPPTPRPDTARATAPRTAPSFAEARALADRGQLGDAERAANAILVATGPTPDLLELLGTIELARGALREAHDHFFRAVYLEPAHRAALLQLALVCDRLGDREQAARYRQRADRAMPSSESPSRS